MLTESRLKRDKRSGRCRENLQKTLDNATPGRSWLKASAEVEKGQKMLDGCDQELKESKEDIAELTKQAGDMGKASSESLIVLLFKVNQFWNISIDYHQNWILL
ncbi:MAG: hypothetical protein J0H55_08430 [Chitinophagaceae bacterium]|nr:hypothetical protein [Chitinophagaceae bacterium]